MAVQLATQFFFGEEAMSKKTADSLDAVKMGRLKAIILAKIGGKRSEENKEALWG